MVFSQPLISNDGHLLQNAFQGSFSLTHAPDSLNYFVQFCNFLDTDYVQRFRWLFVTLVILNA